LDPVAEGWTENRAEARSLAVAAVMVETSRQSIAVGYQRVKFAGALELPRLGSVWRFQIGRAALSV
jgi:hypothetical protein